MKRYLIVLGFCITAISTFAQQPASDFVQYVKPLTGTKNMGHTYPGATVPFGMVQLSPDTDTISYEAGGKYNPNVYRYCAGYQYSDSTIVGFSHTHFSGTGHSDLGDFLIMPTVGALHLNPGTAENPSTGYRSRYSHATEVAIPDYYKVELADYGIKAELTATTRVGFHRYTFPKTADAHVILDLIHGIYNYPGKDVWTFVRVENDTLVTGYRQTTGWARTRTLYFAMVFSRPIKEYGQQKLDKSVYRGFWRKFDETKNFPEMAGRDVRLYFNFDTREKQMVQIKFAISSVSTEGALANLKAETPGWDFDAVVKQGQDDWNQELGKVQAQFINNKDKETFYTSLYHAFLSPTVYSDVDGRYRGLDQNNHKAQGFTDYTTFSVWDTYRALHPLFNLLQPARNRDMIQSMLAHYNQSVHKMLPIWSNSANEDWCMTGYHSVAVIADAYVKNNLPVDPAVALEVCVTTANHRSYDGLGYYIDLGYVPEDKNSSSVSKTLEYAYDDWCIAQMAHKVGNASIEKEFLHRSENFKNVFDTTIGFTRPRLSSGAWKANFDALKTDGEGFVEGNSWNYSLFIPHQPKELISLMGGKKRLGEHLDTLFTMTMDDKYFAETEDITRDGMMGGYIQGNEPGHHIPYLYNWSDRPWKTQERVRAILETMYGNTPDGLCGNDDCGQMSAWYIFGALGFYPFCPGSVEYAIGSPLVKSATIKLENGKTINIEAVNQSEKNIYIQKVLLNGKELHRRYLLHSELESGPSIQFYMGAKPNKKW
ncbi:MAG TPA: GH92 family glycosyl hydrolase [Williamwhitmania sp.]|nr:GH92 family glycosyl hydrolase [Williamwhitmania sp.]